MKPATQKEDPARQERRDVRSGKQQIPAGLQHTINFAQQIPWVFDVFYDLQTADCIERVLYGSGYPGVDVQLHKRNVRRYPLFRVHIERRHAIAEIRETLRESTRSRADIQHLLPR